MKSKTKEARAAIAEAAGRLEELQAENKALRDADGRFAGRKNE